MAKPRIALDAHIEDYLRSQSERVLGKPSSEVTSADLATLTNTLVYEHKLAYQASRQIPIAKLFNWLVNLIPGNKVVTMPLSQSAEAPALKASPVDNFDFDADLGDLYEDEAA